MKANWQIIVVFILFSCNHQGNHKDLIGKGTPSIQIEKDSQHDLNLILERKFRQADTILLVSHTLGIDESVAHLDAVIPVVMERNEIRRSIIKEQYRLNNIERDSLLKILLMPTNYDSVKYSRCCMPHHAIFIIKGKEISYLDLCFHCFCLFCSSDFAELKGYQDQKWDRLLSFFKKKGFKYEIPE